MAIISTPTNVSVSLRLNAGTNSEGKAIVKSTSIPGLDATRASATGADTRIHAIASKLSNMVEFPTVSIRKTVTSVIADEA